VGQFARSAAVRRRWALAGLTMLLVAAPAFPCGGPGAAIVDRPLVPLHEFLSRALTEDDYEARLRPELRFLEPFHAVMPDSVARLYAFAYESGYAPEPPDDSVVRRFESEHLGPAKDAIARGAYADAGALARRAINAVLDMPAGVATPYSDVLRAAVEIVDVAPHLAPSDRAAAARYFAGTVATRQALSASGSLPPTLVRSFAVSVLPRDSAGTYADAHRDSPRLASLRFVALQHAMRTGIPDGWAGSMKDSVPPGRWRDLGRLHDEWLSRFGDHPLADYVRLSRERLFYFEGDSARPWNELLALYPRHRERVLGEMRYLVYHGMVPVSLDDPRIDWPLRTALLMEARATPEQWTAYWRATESHRPERWALPMQERLLWRAAEIARSSGVLPDGFPRRAMAPSAVWAQLRLIALLQAGDIPAALEQADSAGDAPDVAAMRVRLHLLRHDWGRAITAAQGEHEAAAYLVRVLAPRPVVNSLARAHGSPFSKDAGLTVAAGRAAAGDWSTAARFATAADPTRARSWTRTALLSADTSRAGQLVFARWMRDQFGRLFFGDDTEWLRGVNRRRSTVVGDTATSENRADRLPWTRADERASLEAHLRDSNELYYALRCYARWLDAATPGTPGLAAVVREADQTYNRLINWDGTNSFFWGEVLEKSPEAQSIRRAGRLLRQQR
jgi:hypothetical protein